MPKKRIKIEHNYYIDAEGLYYESVVSGVVKEQFNINGVVNIAEYTDVNILYLCYIDEND
ncbi:hypothetical protein CMI47_16775 [Candidatus Pacearchaeota archaeon]|jgi:hypothetical protein|nr:hypothetical protein [Candidatus Pacearchaeota archaeon]|tara:strand:- start:3630 stop:3809 length:180 start_codon:yes stop_codon:yes gene_type:complete